MALLEVAEAQAYDHGCVWSAEEAESLLAASRKAAAAVRDLNGFAARAREIENASEAMQRDGTHV
ncbi:MAG: hypothetical protein ACOZNI_20890 [Myxococcota bacterium]